MIELAWGWAALAVLAGAAPLPSWIVRLATGKDLRRSGTGNAGIAAVFYGAGRKVGTVVVLAEVLRSVLVVLVGLLLGGTPLALATLLGLVVGRVLAGSVGTTTLFWGGLVAVPLAALGTSGVALVVFLVSRSRRVASWAGYGSFPVFVWLTTGGLPAVALAAAVGVVLLGAGLWRKPDLDQDVAGTQGGRRLLLFLQGKRAIPTLDHRLNATVHGPKAARLAELRRGGFPVPPGWVILPGLPAARAVRSLPGHSWPVIVRSSSRSEDGDERSQAGQFLSVPDVADATALAEAIGRVRLSGGPGADRSGAIPVLVQPMIAATWSGVAFTRDPITGESRLLVEAELGTGGTVDGRGRPERVSVTWDGPVEDGLVPAAAIRDLRDLARRIEAQAGGTPQDIEWAWDGTQVWILQARPITSLLPIWTRNLANEFIPGAMHPLAWSVNRPSICGTWGDLFTLALGEKAAGLDFLQTATLHRSHGYFNQTLLGQIFGRLGLPAGGLSFLARGRGAGRMSPAVIGQNVPGLLRLVRAEIALAGRWRRERAGRFGPVLDAPPLAADPAAPAAALWQEAEILRDHLAAITWFKIVGPIGFQVRRLLFRIPEDWYAGIQPPEVRAIRRIRELAPVAATSPAAREEAIRAIAAEFGYLSPNGVSIGVATWAEQPALIGELLDAFATLPEGETAAPSGAGPSGLVARWKLARIAPRVRLNAEVAEDYARLLARLRATMLALGERLAASDALDAAEDVLFLEWDEVRSLVADGSAGVRPVVAARRDAFTRDAVTTPPDAVYGNVIPDVAEPPRFGGMVLKGIPGSAGTVEGTVRVLRDLSDVTGISKDTVLVVPFTEAGWAPVLVQAGAIVSEVGGQLSHGAIIAREFRVPAVMDVPDATRVLRDGQRVTVSGSRGTVAVLPVGGPPGTGTPRSGPPASSPAPPPVPTAGPPAGR